MFIIICMLNMPSTFQSILRESRIKQFPKAQIILYKDDLPPDVYVVKSGAVKLYDIDDQGNEKILHIVGPNTLLPFAFFSGKNVPLHWFYVTLTDCEVYVISRSSLDEAILADGSLAMYLMNVFATDVHELLVRLSSLEKTTVPDKMQAVLKFLAVRHATKRSNGWWRVSFNVNHQLLADLSGITRESAAMAMKELQKEKLVRSPRLGTLDINKDKLIGSTE